MHRFNSAAEEQIDVVYPMLNHGYIQLVDYMGNDERIAEAARQSTTGDTKGDKGDRGLIRYMLDCSHPPHSSPFEMVETVWKVRLPIFVARQWVRHRTASLNEYSGRYSVLPDEAYIPDRERLRGGAQDTVNKQGSVKGNMPEASIPMVQALMEGEQANVFSTYHDYLDQFELSKELARINLPLSSYTTWMWKIDLHNLFHFLGLRTDGHAQYEIRVYADKMLDIAKHIAPTAFEAFYDFKLKAKTLSRMQINSLIEAADNTCPEAHQLTTLIHKVFGENSIPEMNFGDNDV